MNPPQITWDAGLYCVPTPIGNLGDITMRALQVLKSCDAVLCEDSRITGKLLNAYDIRGKKKIVYNDHSDAETRDYIVKIVRDGAVLALVSDAGTPLISDPGYKLVRACIDAGLYVTALPGANAVLPALQLSALPSDKFVFGGFLPHKSGAVRTMLARYAVYPETLVFYDTATRLSKNLHSLIDVLGNRQIAVVREISKLYEEAIRGSASDVLQKISEHPPRGEIVLVVAGCTDVVAADHSLDETIANALKSGESVKALSARLATDTGLKKRDIYARALDIQAANQS